MVGLIVLFVLVNRVGGVLDLWDLLVRVIALVICLVTLVLALDLVAGACGSRLLCWLGVGYWFCLVAAEFCGGCVWIGYLVVVVCCLECWCWFLLMFGFGDCWLVGFVAV